jgi:tetratricopeptide (TPR) repeat protein
LDIPSGPERLGDSDSLAEAIDLYRQALVLRPLRHLNRSITLSNLASALITQFEQLRDLESLAEAIDLYRQALDLHPLEHPKRFTLLENLATALTRRSERLGDLIALTEAIALHRQALASLPVGHPRRSTMLSNLAHALNIRYDQIGGLHFLSEAIDLHHQALALHPSGHPNRSSSLNNLAGALRSRSLDLRPLGHPDRSASLKNLAGALTTRFEQLGDTDSLTEAINLHRHALELRTLGHPDRSSSLCRIAKCMLQNVSHTFDFMNGVQHVLEALRDETAPARYLLRRVAPVLRVIETGYQSMTGGSRPDIDDMVLQAHILTIRLLPRAASFGHNHTTRLRELLGADILSRNAATRAIHMRREEEAVEMLEEGRGVFWAQALHLRGTELDLLPSEDAEELQRLFHFLEEGSVRDDMSTVAQKERDVEKRRLHREAAEAIIADIRTRPGMKRFLMPPAFTTLLQSLAEGFFVLLNVSELGHHALIMNGCTRYISSVTLKLPARISGFKRKVVQQDLSRVHVAAEPELSEDDLPGTAEQEESSRASNQRERVIRTFEEDLADFWVFIVKPIVNMLQLKVSPPTPSTRSRADLRSQRCIGRERARVWWCPTGNLTFLPIHAAGGYIRLRLARERSGASDECASDYLVSSYTPSIL